MNLSFGQIRTSQNPRGNTGPIAVQSSATLNFFMLCTS